MNDFKLQCPKCGCNVYFDDGVKSIEYIGSASFDCHNCNTVLVLKDGKPVSMFDEIKKRYPDATEEDFGHIKVSR